MKSKLNPIIELIALSGILLMLNQGCSFFEKDRTEYQKNVVGRIKIQKQENSQRENLVYAETDEIFAVIVDDCSLAFFDSIHNRIYIESFLNESTGNYYEIIVINPTSKFVSGAIKKRRISSAEFISKTASLHKL